MLEWLYKLRDPVGGTIDVHGLDKTVYTCWIDDERIFPLDARMGIVGSRFPTGVVAVSGDSSGSSIPTDSGNRSGAWLGMAILTPAKGNTTVRGYAHGAGPYGLETYDCGAVSDLARIAATKGEK